MTRINPHERLAQLHATRVSLDSDWQSLPTRAGKYARNPYIGDAMRVITFLLWQVRLWLVGFAQRCHERHIQLVSRSLRSLWDRNTRFARFVDRVSAWDPLVGYNRLWLRRWLYRLRYPIQTQRFWSLELVMNTIYRFVPRPSLGRYEFAEPAYQLRAEWLDSHSEYADYTTGDQSWGMWYALFDQISVPWSLKPETWMMKVDSHGFVGVELYTDREEAMADFTAYDQAYVSDPTNEDEYGDPDDSAFNIEGQPEFNGAFGGTQVAQ